MRTLSIISAFLFAFVASVFGSESNLSLTYRQYKDSRNVNLKVSSDTIVYELTAKQYRDGHFTLLAPPFLYANIDDTLILGELRDQGILSLLLEPTSRESIPYTYRAHTSLKHISNLSQSPTLSGIALCLGKADIIALSPTMNPRSPLGMGIVLGGDNLFAGALYASQNEKLIQEAKVPFQTDWNNMGQGRSMLFTILGANARASIRSLDIESSAFVQNAWDLLLGGGTTCGWNLRIQTRNITTTVDRRLGGNGVTLKSLKPKDRPCESLYASTQIIGQNHMRLDLSYGVDTYESPIYGGQSQRRTILWEVGTTMYGITAKVTSSTSYDADRGKVSDSTYLISTKKDDVTLKASFQLNRNTDSSLSATDATLEVTAPKATLVLKGSQAKLSMNWEKSLEDIKIMVSVDQDRYLTFSAVLNEL